MKTEGIEGVSFIIIIIIIIIILKKPTGKDRNWLNSLIIFTDLRVN